MDIHIFTMVWIQNYDPNLDDLYLYSNKPKLYPTYEIGYIAGYNPNNFSKEQTITIDGVEQTVSLDFSGIENTGFIRYGDGGGVYCGFETCQTLPWPRCQAAWYYVLVGQNTAGGNDCILASQSFFNNHLNTTLQGTLTYPAEKINPIYPNNAQYWENPNLWNHGSYTAHSLLENEDTSGETVYILTIGHPITISPCARPQTFAFLDPETNTRLYREFECPCVAWGLPVINPSAGAFLSCTSCCSDEYSILTGSRPSTDIGIPGGDRYPRLWVMKAGQDPLPLSIKRYKVLVGPIRENFPVYGIDSQFRVTKGIIKSGIASFDRNHHNTPISDQSTYTSVRIKLTGGEGDDGGWSQFTVTPEGETIYVGTGTPINGSVVLNQNDSINAPDPTRCPTPDDYFYIDSNGVLQFNTYCAPAVFHPETVIPNYPENDIQIRSNLNQSGQTTVSYLNEINKVLQNLNKPKIVSYTFPEFVINEDELNFPNISDSALTYPLKTSPYFSRESKNTFFQNSNLIAFDAQKILQAAELNELQEKFYKNQKVLIEYTNKWLSGQNINEKQTDILGFLPTVNQKIQTEQTWTCSKIIPTDKTSIKINSYPSQSLFIKIKPDWYMLNSIFEEADTTTNPVSTTSKKYQNVSFFKINEEVSTSVDFNTLAEGETILVVMNIDISNLINCNQYQELRDNSGGSSANSPCGAKRNLLALTNITTYKLQELSSYGVLTTTNRQKYPFNSWAIPYSVPHLLMFIKKENGQLNFYYANGIKVPT
jgi:hypothetical protein